VRILAPVVLLVVLAGCGGDTNVGVAPPTADVAASPEATADPTASPTPEPSPTPSPTAEAREPEIAAFNVISGVISGSIGPPTLMVRIHNPNEGIGLIRAGFELTAVAADGAIIDVFGTEGLPGAPCCTIYRLPPGGDFGLSITMEPGAPAVASLELAVMAQWMDWSTVEPPESELTETVVAIHELAGPQLTGRVTTPSAAEDGPFNVWIGAFVQSPTGLIVIRGGVDCVATAEGRAFSLDTFLGDAVQGPLTLESAVAYTTTVPGVTEPAPNC
jgi:hypothetical protein